MSTWHGVMADEEKLSRCKISTDTVYNTLKTHTRYAHIVRGRPTLKDVERFRNESVREPHERSLNERTFLTEPFIKRHATSSELSNGNREKHGIQNGRFAFSSLRYSRAYRRKSQHFKTSLLVVKICLSVYRE